MVCLHRARLSDPVTIRAERRGGSMFKIEYHPRAAPRDAGADMAELHLHENTALLMLSSRFTPQPSTAPHVVYGQLRSLLCAFYLPN